TSKVEVSIQATLPLSKSGAASSSATSAAAAASGASSAHAPVGAAAGAGRATAAASAGGSCAIAGSAARAITAMASRKRTARVWHRALRPAIHDIVMGVLRWGSERVAADLAGTDAHGVFDGTDENLAVADPAGAGRLPDGIE